jgi:hypothetical protein
MFENRVLRKIFGTKEEEVAGGWRILHNEELHNVYVSPKIKKDGVDGSCSTHGRNENCGQNCGRESRTEDATWKV